MKMIKTIGDDKVPVYEAGDVVTLRTAAGRKFLKGTKWTVLNVVEDNSAPSMNLYRLEDKKLGVTVEILGIYMALCNED